MDYALDVLVSGGDAAVADAEAPGDGGADLGRVEYLSLDLAALDPVGGEGLEGDLLPEGEAQELHSSEQVTLEAAYPADLGDEGAVIPGEGRPVRRLVQVSGLHVCPFLPRLLDREFDSTQCLRRYYGAAKVSGKWRSISQGGDNVLIQALSAQEAL